MPLVLYPARVDAALNAHLELPRLKAWFEAPLLLTTIGLPLGLLAALALSFWSKGLLALVALLLPVFLFLFVAAEVLGRFARKRRGTGSFMRATRWMTGKWYRTSLVFVLTTLPVLAYCMGAQIVWNTLAAFLTTFKLSTASTVIWQWQAPAAAYGVSVAVAAVWGIARRGHYAKEFRRQYQLYQQETNGGQLRKAELVWNAVRQLPRLDFDGRRNTKEVPTETAVMLKQALQRAGFKVADTPGTEREGPRLIEEYELLSLRRGKRNYRADLALIHPARNLKIDIELDGGYHYTSKQRKKDNNRNREFLNRGWIVMRFDNEEIERDVQGCVRRIEAVLRELEQVPGEAILAERRAT